MSRVGTTGSAPPEVAHVVAVLGPNPASLTELLWALVRQRGMQVASVRIAVESARTLVYLERELLGGLGAYGELRARLGAAIPAEPLVVRPPTLPAHETADEVVHAMPEVFWTAARDALEAAGTEERVVFGLTGGRRRASHAAVASVFQFLARPQDLLLDVRVSERAAEGGSGFFFPEQGQQELSGAVRGVPVSFRAEEVAIRLDEVPVPRLRPLLAVQPPETFVLASALCSEAVARLRAPEVHLDLVEAKLRVDGLEVTLSRGSFALLALALCAGGSEGGVPSMCFDELAAFLAEMPWRFSFKSGSLFEHLVDGEPGGRAKTSANNLRAHWSSLRVALSRGGCPAYALDVLTPGPYTAKGADGGRRSFRRVRLPRSRLVVVWPG